jgi:hypothetical protein
MANGELHRKDARNSKFPLAGHHDGSNIKIENQETGTVKSQKRSMDWSYL